METKHIIGLSGGKDSTAMAIRLAEVEPRDYIFLTTPTGDELPEMLSHWDALARLLGKPLVKLSNKTLDFYISHFNALPNFRQRWCTRLLKIEPTIAFIKANQPAVLYVGLRADEEMRKGIYSEDVECRFPLREWGWGLAEVQGFLKERRIHIPERTDCARCYAQRIDEWKNLWRKHPEIFAEAEAQEKAIGKTFRTPNKGDGWATSLEGLRRQFEAGRTTRAERRRLKLLEEDEEQEATACRVCSL